MVGSHAELVTAWARGRPEVNFLFRFSVDCVRRSELREGCAYKRVWV